MKTIEQRADEIPRKWGRPKIGGVLYDRPSAMAKALDDPGGLFNYYSGLSAYGTAISPDLIAGLTTTDPTNKKALYAFGRQAMERARSGSAATMGTALHSATEMLDLGKSLELLPSKVQADARAYRAAIDAAGLIPLCGEIFVVCDELRCAGTFDRLYQGATRHVIGDVKTSQNPDSAKWSALAWSIQIAIYSRSKPYLDGAVVEWSDVGLPEPDRLHGAVVHVPQGSGTASVFSVDLEVGWYAAQIAREVLDLRRRKDVVTAV